LRVTWGYRLLGPRPPPPTLHAVRRDAPAEESLDPAPPDDFCNYHQRTDTLPSIRIPAPPCAAYDAYRRDVEGALVLACSRARDLPLSKKDNEVLRDRDQPYRGGTHGDASTPHAFDSAAATDRDAACGRRLGPTTACGDGRWRTALDCTGRGEPSEGPLRRRMLAA